MSAARCRRWHEIRRLERRLRYAWGTLRARLLRRLARFAGGAA